MEYCVLGSLQLAENGRALPLERGGPRLLLAALLVHRNEVVTTRRLVDELWPRGAPETATKIVQLYVSQLRKLVGSERLATKGGGYLLRVEPGELDADRFEVLVQEARGAEPLRARRLLTDALALWRGPAFAEFEDRDFAHWEAERLNELRSSAEEDRIECELALGRHALLAAELPRLVREHPLRERLHGQLMLALYRSGRQAEALEAYQDARTTLVEELGLEPSPPLQRLEQAILQHDPELAAPPTVAVEEERPPQPPARASLSRRLAAVGAALLAVAIGTALYEETGGGAQRQQSQISVRPNSLVVLDPRSGRVEADVGVGSRPSRVAAEGDDVWVLNADDRTVSRVDAFTHQVRTVAVGGRPTDLATGGGAVWVVQSAARVTVYRIDPVTTTTTDRIVLPGRFPYVVQVYIAYGAGAVWVSRGANGGGVLWRIEPGSGVVRRIALPAGGGPVVVGADAVWVTSGAALTRVDPQTLSVHSIREIPFDVPSGPTVGAGQLWVPDLANLHNEYSANAGTLWDVDPGTGEATRTVVGGGASAAVFHSGSVWVACSLSGTVVRVDPSREAVVQTIHLGGSPSGLAFTKNELWVSVS